MDIGAAFDSASKASPLNIGAAFDKAIGSKGTGDDAVMRAHGLNDATIAAVKKNPSYKSGMYTAAKPKSYAPKDVVVPTGIPFVGGVSLGNVIAGINNVGQEINHALAYGISKVTGDPSYEAMANLEGKLTQGVVAKNTYQGPGSHAKVLGVDLGNKGQLLGNVLASAPLTPMKVFKGAGIAGKIGNVVVPGAIGGALTETGDYDPNNPNGYIKDVSGRMAAGGIASGVLSGAAKVSGKLIGKAANTLAGAVMEKAGKTELKDVATPIAKVMEKVAPGWTLDGTYTAKNAMPVISAYKNIVNTLKDDGALTPEANANALTIADITLNPSATALQGLMAHIKNNTFGLANLQGEQKEVLTKYVVDHIAGGLKKDIDGMSYVGEKAIRYDADLGDSVASMIAAGMDNANSYAGMVKSSLQAQHYVNRKSSDEMFEAARQLMSQDQRNIDFGPIVNDFKSLLQGPGFGVKTTPHSAAAIRVLKSLLADVQGTLPTINGENVTGGIGHLGSIANMKHVVPPSAPLKYAQVDAMRKAVQNVIDNMYTGNPTGIGKSDLPIMRKAVTMLDNILEDHATTSGLADADGVAVGQLFRNARDFYRENVVPYGSLPMDAHPDEVADKLIKKGVAENFTASNFDLLDPKGKKLLQNHIIDVGVAKSLDGEHIDMAKFLSHLNSFSGAIKTTFPDQTELKGLKLVIEHLNQTKNKGNTPYGRLTNPKTWPVVAVMPILRWAITDAKAKRYLLSATQTPKALDNIINGMMREMSAGLAKHATVQGVVSGRTQNSLNSNPQE